jgi:hypothetical protein
MGFESPPKFSVKTNMQVKLKTTSSKKLTKENSCIKLIMDTWKTIAADKICGVTLLARSKADIRNSNMTTETEIIISRTAIIVSKPSELITL